MILFKYCKANVPGVVNEFFEELHNKLSLFEFSTVDEARSKYLEVFNQAITKFTYEDAQVDFIKEAKFGLLWDGFCMACEGSEAFNIFSNSTTFFYYALDGVNYPHPKGCELFVFASSV